MQKRYRVIMHKIAFEPRSELVGSMDKIDQADRRAKEVSGQISAGYVMVVDMKEKCIMSVLYPSSDRAEK